MKKIELNLDEFELEMLQMAADMYTKGNVEDLILSLIKAGYDHLEEMDNYLPEKYRNKKRPSSTFYFEGKRIK